MHPLFFVFSKQRFCSKNINAPCQIATYTSDSALSWRTVETGDLPSAREGLKAAVVGNVVYVSGGWNHGDNDIFTAILSWDPLQEKWTHAGDLKMARARPGAVAIRSNTIECATNA